MLLAVDIGNTSTKFGVFDGDDLTFKFSYPTGESPIDLAPEIAGDITSAVACSVVPDVNDNLAALILKRFDAKTVFVTNDLDFGLDIKYEPLDGAGTDRVVNAFAAVEKFGTPVIVCSLGTATTIDVVNEKKELLGGLITAGMRTSAKALHLNTARLPEVEINKPDKLINDSTETAIRAGVFYSQVGLIETAVTRISGELPAKPKVIATGGFAEIIASECKVIDVVEEDLLLQGLRLLNTRLYP
jgi:type III pantothenate kinase